MTEPQNRAERAAGMARAQPAQWPVDHGQPIAAASGGRQGRPVPDYPAEIQRFLGE